MRIVGDASDVLKKLEQLHSRIVAEAAIAMERTQVAVTDAVQRNLMNSILRPNESDGTLKRAITGQVRKSADAIIAGIGHFDTMNEQAPYWHVLDQGSSHMVGRWIPGFFINPSGYKVDFVASPTKGTTTQDQFTYLPGASYGNFMHITHPIRPKHYFKAGRMAVEQQVSGFFNEGWRRAFSK